MDTIFTLGDYDDNDNIKVNLDELYERKKQHDLNTLQTYNRILTRINNKIKLVSRQQVNIQYCWYVIPEHIIGVPRFDKDACPAYLIDKLKENGFVIRYTHPNLLFISWKHWVPSYVRSEIKKKTGVAIDGYGKKIDKQGKAITSNQPDNPDELMFHQSNNIPIEAKNKEYTSIDEYKPTGQLIYNQNLLRTIESKSKNNK